MRPRVILDLCGGTGAWSAPYQRRKGYKVIVVTLPDYDVRRFARNFYRRTCPLPARVHGILAAPPCDEFARSGARWWRNKSRHHPELLRNALDVVDACLAVIKRYERQGDLAWWALENPLGRLWQLRPQLVPVLKFDPCDYGDRWTKRTWVAGRFCRPIKEAVRPSVRNVLEFPGWRNLGGKSERTKRLRSITSPGFARAFCEANR